MEKVKIYVEKIDRSVYLWLELMVLFFAFPLLFSVTIKTNPLPFVLLGGLVGFYILYSDSDFDRSSFYKLPSLNLEYARIFLQVLFLSGLLYYFISTYFPEHLFIFLRKDFYLWLDIILVYTFLGVYPQEIIYRAFIFHRYKDLFTKETGLIHISSLSFAFGHIIYLNYISVFLALLGGYIFSITYYRTRSVFLVYIEHLLYGTLLYTIGFGSYFYSGFIK
ncbi:MAG: CPBP family intramembrane metalloprotease [Calditerrivibrio sp.]|nr:CPBP family intramembrane metalloprotease [Calditerrivibrio sp.]MCA1932974.1 CPBP family intramembrane metalloprotease [Calditerrivibrio sp.]